MKNATTLLASLVIFFQTSLAQHMNFNFGRFDTIEVKQGTQTLMVPFAGGLNSPQFSQIDLNLDGVLDLVIFERTTFKLKTFVNKGIENDPSYVYAPEFESQFPKISDIVVLKDYDFDGKVDFFTYKNPGINVWKNVSDSTLKFEEITYFEHTNVGYVNYITADYFGNYKANVYNLPGDIFSIEDIDDDGDLDLMNFGVWGSTMELHRNLSMEVTGKPDSMFFEYQSACWCKFIENSTSNDVTFPYNCKSNAPSNNNQSNNGSNRHAGSTILTLDLDGDGDKDYVLGDIGFNNLVALTNGGDDINCAVSQVDNNFPSYDVPADIFVFPGAYYLDIDNNGKKELLVAPNANTEVLTTNNVWLYKDLSATAATNFSLIKQDFLVGDMLDFGSAANPVFFDANADGLMDLIIGSYGYYQNGNYVASLAYYQNIGDSALPKYELVTKNYMNIESRGFTAIYPTFGDLDNDGDMDMILGEYSGRLHYYKNVSTAGSPANYVADQLLGLDSIDVGQYSTPLLYDINNNGVLDLIIGERDGTINYLENKGTSTSALFLKSDLKPNFGGVIHQNFVKTGYTVPYLAKLDTMGKYNQTNGKLYLFVGTESGYVYIYDQVENNLTGNFNLIDSIYSGTYRTSIHGGDFNHDSIIDFALGELGGGMSFWLKGRGIVIPKPPVDTSNIAVNKVSNTQNSFTIVPNPANNQAVIYFTNPTQINLVLQVYNLTGKSIITHQIAQNKTSYNLEINNLPQGVYMVVVFDENGSFIAAKKLIVTN